jgi:ApeA N-terminal domain 1
MAHKQKWHSFRVNGMWQKPGDDHHIPGRLIVSRSGGLSLTLIVDDRNAPPPPAGPIGMDDADRAGLVMTGQTTDGRFFTLWDGFVLGGDLWSHIFRTVGQKELCFNWGIEGIYYPKPNDLRFSRANVRISILSNWLGRSNFGVDHNKSTEQIWATLQCTRPMPLKYSSGDGPELSFGWSASGPKMQLFQTSAIINIHPKLGIKYDEPASLNTCLTDLWTITDLNPYS